MLDIICESRKGETVVKPPIKPSVMAEQRSWSRLTLQAHINTAECACVPGLCVVSGLTDGCSFRVSHYPECNLA